MPALIICALLPILVGLTASIWFGALTPSVRRLRRGAQWINASTVVPTVPLAISDIRDHDKCGDRIVVAHYLGDWTKDLEAKIFFALAYQNLLFLFCVIFFAIKGNSSLQDPNITWSNFISSALTYWPFSLSVVVTIVEVGTTLKMVSDAANKYRNIIAKYQPPRVRLMQRWRNFWNKI